ncbi:MAG: TRAP transporter small permease [Rhizobiaceae bacterium]|nr:TRAP transporter small permease [Rhizobiaceae bacterium]MCV0406356.1 TRAP transporter small permease [Rhizobiaceae bacterium]
MKVDAEATPRTSGPIGWYFSAIRFLAGTSMLVILGVMVAQVIARYIFNASLIWAEELCRYLLIWQTFLFIGMAYHRGELVAVDIVPALLRPTARFVLKFLVTIPILVFLYLMTVNGWLYSTRFSGQVVPAVDFIAMSLLGHGVGLSIFYVYVSVAVGCGLLALHMIGSLIVDARELLAGRAPAQGMDLPKV